MKAGDYRTSVGPVPIEFPPTRWSVVLEAAQADEEKARQALAQLCKDYQAAIHGYFKLKCRDPHLAEDLTGSFIEHLLEKNRFRNFEKRENMRFRNYLSRALKNFLIDHLPLPPAPEPTDPDSLGVVDAEPGKKLDIQFAVSIHERAVAAVEAGVKPEKTARFERLRLFLVREPHAGEYESTAKDLGLSQPALRSAVYRVRNDYVERFRAEVAETVHLERGELQQEMRYLIGLLPEALASGLIRA